MPATTTVTKKKPATKKSTTKAPSVRMTLAETMRELEQAGSEQTRKTYARHGAIGPMFGVSFATLKGLLKRIGVDPELACALWETGNFDARNLAVKIVDPTRLSSADLDRWARDTSALSACGAYVSMLAAEGPHAASKATEWLAAKDDWARVAGWGLIGQLAQRQESLPDSWFADHLVEIERTISHAPNAERESMNAALIAIGCHNEALRKTATTVAKRIGKVHIDHGDTACKTPDAAAYIEKTWAHSLSKGFESPAAHERTREVPRLRC